MQPGNTDIKNIFNILKKLPFVKVPLYYFPLFISMLYFPRETFMFGTTVILFKNINDETTRRQESNSFYPNFSEGETSESENEIEPKDEVSTVNEDEIEPKNEVSTVDEDEFEPKVSTVDEDEIEPKNEVSTVDEDEFEPKDEVSTVVNKSESESRESKEDYNLVDSSDNDSVESNSSSAMFWKFF